MPLSIRQERLGGVLVVSLAGRLDNESAADFELAAQELLAAGTRHLLLDVAELGYISNAGLRVLGKLSKALDTPSTSLRLAGVTHNVRQVFDATGISTLLSMYPDRGAALSSHPAAGMDSQLAQLAARLIGADAIHLSEEKVPNAAALAEQALALLSGGGAAPRAAQAMLDRTQMFQRVQAAVVDSARPASAKVPWWRRLFGSRD